MVEAAACGMRDDGAVGKVEDVDVSDGGAVEARAEVYTLVMTTYKWRITTY